MKCPLCKCESFYVKNPNDDFETWEFQCPDGVVCFEDGVDPEAAPDITPETETFCQRCSWHGKFEGLNP